MDKERTCCRSGNPPMACSTGEVIWLSTSSGRQARRERVDLHLDRRRVGEGVDVEAGQGNRPSTTKPTAPARTRRRLSQRPVNERREHSIPST